MVSLLINIWLQVHVCIAREQQGRGVGDYCPILDYWRVTKPSLPPPRPLAGKRDGNEQKCYVL